MSEKTIESVVGRDEHVILLDALEAYVVHCRKKAYEALLAGLAYGDVFWSEKADKARALQAELRDIQH